MGYIRIDEYSFRCNFDSLMYALRAPEIMSCLPYNSALALEEYFRFIAEERFENWNPLHTADWDDIASVLSDEELDVQGRARLLRSLRVFPKAPKKTGHKFFSELERCLDDPNSEVIYEAVFLSRQWGKFKSSFRPAIIACLARLDTCRPVDIDDFARDLGTLYASLAIVDDDVLYTGELMVSNDYHVAYLSGHCLLAIGERARLAENNIISCLHKNERGVNDVLEDLAQQLISKLGLNVPKAIEVLV